MINCPECSQQISEIAKTCPHCGCNVKQAQKIRRKQEQMEALNKMSPEQQKKANIISLVVVGLFVILIIAISQYDDGSCERCKEEGIYEIGDDKYCEKHYIEVLGEVIAWD